MTQRIIYKVTLWEDVKGDRPDLKDSIRNILKATEKYGVSECNIAQVLDLDLIQQQPRLPPQQPQGAQDE